MSKNRMIDRMNSLAINISKSKIISTISQGMMTLLPALMIGTLGSLGQQIPFTAYQNFINSTGLMAVFTGMVDVTTNMFSVYAVFSLAYVWAKNEKKDGVACRPDFGKRKHPPILGEGGPIDKHKKAAVWLYSSLFMTLFPGSPQALPSSPGRGFTFVNPPEPADLGKMAQM